MFTAVDITNASVPMGFASGILLPVTNVKFMLCISVVIFSTCFINVKLFFLCWWCLTQISGEFGQHTVRLGSEAR